MQLSRLFKYMNNSPLFRKAALNANRVKWAGEIVLARPLSFAFLTAAAVGMGLLIVGFLLAGSYTKRSTVSGQLAPDVGVLKIYAPQYGTVLEKRVREGQLVKRGELLYLVSSERQSSTDIKRAHARGAQTIRWTSNTAWPWRHASPISQFPSWH